MTHTHRFACMVFSKSSTPLLSSPMVRQLMVVVVPPEKLGLVGGKYLLEDLPMVKVLVLVAIDRQNNLEFGLRIPKLADRLQALAKVVRILFKCGDLKCDRTDLCSTITPM